MRNLFLMAVVGVALATPFCRPAHAQDSNEQTLNENMHGIPRNAPSLSLPSIYGLNPCATGSAIGLTTPIVGIGGAVSSIDRDCEVRNSAAVVVSALDDKRLAREILCEIKEIRDASARLGQPCIADTGNKPVAVSTNSNRQAAVAASLEAPPALTIVANAPAFCHQPGLVLNFYPECTTEAGARKAKAKHDAIVRYEDAVVARRQALHADR